MVVYWYSDGMSTAPETATAKEIQRARAKYLRDLFEPWTYRKLEARTGIGRMALQARLTGETALTVPDLEVLAPVIRMTPEELFAELLAVKLPEVDSNHQPAGFTLRSMRSVTELSPRPVNDDNHLAAILQFPSAPKVGAELAVHSTVG